MNPVFGLGISNENQFSVLPQSLPENIAFLEISGDLLEQPGVVQKLKRFSRKQHIAVVVRNLIPSYLAEAVPDSPLRLRTEFDRKFRAQCRLAAETGCRVVAVDFDIPHALADDSYHTKLTGLLHSLSGTLEDLKLLMALPLRLPCAAAGGASPTAFLAFKHRLLYPGFRFRIDFRYEESGAFETLEQNLEILKFERNFWSISYQPDVDTILTGNVLERLRTAWKYESRIPVFVCVESGMASPDEDMLRCLNKLIGDFLCQKDNGSDG